MGRHRGPLRTGGLFVLLAALVLAVGAFYGATGLVAAALVALALAAVGYFASDGLALRSMQAYPVSEASHPQLFHLVRELSTAAHHPMPHLFVSPTVAPNAFATGRTPRRAAVCCTSGPLDLLDERELRGVLAHELSHAYNRDILVSPVAAALASVVMLPAQFARLLPFGRRDDDESGPAGLLAAAILGPLAAGMLHFPLARAREYRADASGAALTGDPLSLASALRKLDAGTRSRPLRAPPELQPMSALMTVKPFPAVGVTRLFSMHPSTAERVTRLETKAGYRR